METKTFCPSDSEKGIRIDLFLSEKLECTRSRIGKLIEEESVRRNGEIVTKSGQTVQPNDLIEVCILPPKEISLEPEDIPLSVVYEDKHLAVIDKQRGLVVHPAGGSESGTLVNALLFKLDNLSGINGEIRPGIVHRLDKDTSGLLVVAKTDEAHLSLSNQLKDRSCHRIYRALLEGVLKQDEGVIDAPIGRSRSDRKKMAVTKDGRVAVTDFKVVERFKKYTLVEFSLRTGRTHQIRVHAKHIGHPVVGDKTYNKAEDKLGAGGQLLHAVGLGFIHPTTGKRMEFKSELPDYFANILEKIR
ncbi:MAG: RluA family pseudouridine synthase [Clostridia bacterium]|nr:RluA family pseudouridine synthase [Clostridia bacterium]